IDITVTFYDPDLYEYYSTYAPDAERFVFTPNSATDGDPWVGGDTTRHPSGFRPTLFADSFYNPREDLSVSESLSGGSQSDWVQWRLAPGSDSIPGSIRTNVEFTLSAPLAGNLFVPQYAKELTAVIDFDTTTQPGGIPEPSGSATMH